MAAQARQNTIVLDFSDLKHLDSSRVDVLVEGHRNLAHHRQMIVLAAPSPAIRKVLSILGLDAVIPVFASVTEAMIYLSAVGQSKEQQRTGS